MRKQTLKALQGSIEKWANIIAGTSNDLGILNCPLCDMYMSGMWEKDCKGCPVNVKTKKLYCANTPYYDWSDHQDTAHRDKLNRKVYCKTCKEIAYEELNFLMGLLPKVE